MWFKRSGVMAWCAAMKKLVIPAYRLYSSKIDVKFQRCNLRKHPMIVPILINCVMASLTDMRDVSLTYLSCAFQDYTLQQVDNWQDLVLSSKPKSPHPQKLDSRGLFVVCPFLNVLIQFLDRPQSWDYHLKLIYTMLSFKWHTIAVKDRQEQERWSSLIVVFRERENLIHWVGQTYRGHQQPYQSSLEGCTVTFLPYVIARNARNYAINTVAPFFTYGKVFTCANIFLQVVVKKNNT